MDQVTSPTRPPAGRITLREVYRGPLAISYATSIATISGVILLYPVLPVLAGDLGVDEAHIGLVIAAFNAPGIVLAPLFGVLADLYGRRWILVLGLTLFGLAGGAAALAPSYEWVLVWRVLQGVGASALLPLTIVLISDILPGEREIHGQGVKVALDRVATIVLPLMGGALAILSWRAAFAAFLLVLVLALAALVWMPETHRRGSDTLRQYFARTGRAIREPRLTLAFATGFVRFFLDYGLYTYLPIIVALRYGSTPVMSGAMIAASAVGAIITAITIDRIYHRVATERLLALAFFASAAIACRAGAGRAAVARRRRDVRVRARQRADLSAAKEPDDPPHPGRAARRRHRRRSPDPADREIIGTGAAWAAAAGGRAGGIGVGTVCAERGVHAGADRDGLAPARCGRCLSYWPYRRRSRSRLRAGLRLRLGSVALCISADVHHANARAPRVAASLIGVRSLRCGVLIGMRPVPQVEHSAVALRGRCLAYRAILGRRLRGLPAAIARIAAGQIDEGGTWAVHIIRQIDDRRCLRGANVPAQRNGRHRDQHAARRPAQFLEP